MSALIGLYKYRAKCGKKYGRLLVWVRLQRDYGGIQRKGGMRKTVEEGWEREIEPKIKGK